MLSAIRRICSAASAGLFTVSSSAPVRTILRSAVADFAAGWAADLSSATTAPAVGRDTGEASRRAMLSRRVLAYVCSKAGTPAALRVRSRLGMAMLAASRIIPLPITRGFQRLWMDFKGSVMADIACLLSRERSANRGLQAIFRGSPARAYLELHERTPVETEYLGVDFGVQGDGYFVLFPASGVLTRAYNSTGQIQGWCDTKSEPQGLKPGRIFCFYGSAEAEPFLSTSFALGF